MDTLFTAKRRSTTIGFKSLSKQVTDESDQPLSAVLLSLSAGQFRSNNLTLDNGTMVFANLVGLD